MKKAVLITICLILALCGCSSKKKSTDRPGVVVTVFPIYDFVRAVGGDLVDIKLLIDPGTEVHSFDPAPSDVIAIEDSDLFVMIGGESDEWANRLISGSSSEVNVLTLMSSVELLTEDGEDEYDEHIWTSPSNAVKMVETVCDKLSEIDSGNAAVYRENADSYIQKINDVRTDISQTVEGSKNKYIIVADRFPFKYLATEFGIEYTAAFGGCAVSTDISLKTMTKLIEAARQNRCNGAFYIEMSNRAVANALNDETGIPLYELQSAHNVTLEQFKSGITYVDIMKRNADALRKVIK